MRPPTTLSAMGEEKTVIQPFRIEVALAGDWRSGYDWRAHETRLNRFPQLTTTIDVPRSTSHTFTNS